MAPPDSRLHGHGAVARLRDVLTREEALRRPHAAARPEAPPLLWRQCQRCHVNAGHELQEGEEGAGRWLDLVLSPQLLLPVRHAPG